MANPGGGRARVCDAKGRWRTTRRAASRGRRGGGAGTLRRPHASAAAGSRRRRRAHRVRTHARTHACVRRPPFKKNETRAQAHPPPAAPTAGGGACGREVQSARGRHCTSTYSPARQQKMQNPTGTACAAAPRFLQTPARAGSLRAASGRFLKTLAQNLSSWRERVPVAPHFLLPGRAGVGAPSQPPPPYLLCACPAPRLRRGTHTNTTDGRARGPGARGAAARAAAPRRTAVQMQRLADESDAAHEAPESGHSRAAPRRAAPRRAAPRAALPVNPMVFFFEPRGGALKGGEREVRRGGRGSERREARGARAGPGGEPSRRRCCIADP